MRRRLLLTAAALAPFAVRAQEPPPPPALPVAASFSILADLAQQVGGDAAAVASLVPPEGDAHAFQPRPSDLRVLQGAAVVIENGLGLDAWLTRLVRSSGFKGTRVVATEGIRPRSMAEAGRSVIDPHAWQDPRLAAMMARTIAAGLASADPARAVLYRARGEDFAARIMELDAAIERQVATVPPANRQVITSHDAFGYYGARYGIRFQGVQGISTEAEPSARDIARLAAQIRRDRIRAVFVENMTDPRIAEAVAREAGAVVGGRVYSDSLSAPDGPAAPYLAMLRHNTALFVAAMVAQ